MTGKRPQAKPRRTQVSLRGESYAMLRKEAKKRGVRITELVEQILDEYERRKRFGG